MLLAKLPVGRLPLRKMDWRNCACAVMPMPTIRAARHIIVNAFFMLLLFKLDLLAVFLFAASFLGLAFFNFDHLFFGDGGVEGRYLGVKVFLFDAAEVLV